jgi:microcystin-dependent protein
MADVTISQLPQTSSPQRSGNVPYSNDITTTKITITQIADLIVPIGSIILWSGSIASIPANWALCNGANGTPNLVDKFILGAGTSAPTVGATGGSKDSIVVSHTHSITDSGHFHATNIAGGSRRGSIASSLEEGLSTMINTSTSTTGITIQSTGSSGTNANMPPYYALAYIMRVS